MKIYRGDQKPDLSIKLSDDGAPVDLTVAQSIRVLGSRDGQKVIDAAVTGDEAGNVIYEWTADDTKTAGRIVIEIEVTWPDGKPQTFRPTSYVEVLPDLG